MDTASLCPLPCHLVLLSQYPTQHGKDPLDTTEAGGVSSSCPFFTFILSSEPWLYGVGWEMWTALTFPRSVRSLVKVPSYRESSSHSRMPGPLKGSEKREREVSLDRKPGWVGTDPQDQEHPSSGTALPRRAESHEPHPLCPLVSPQMRVLHRKCWLPLLPCYCPGSSGPIKSPFYCTCQETQTSSFSTCF